MTRLTQKSFTGGELSPSLYARNDLAKYANGLKTLKNGFVRAEGCVANRSGLEFVCEVKDSTKKTRIIPFAFNTEQTYIIELGNQYARYIKDGGQIVCPNSYGAITNCSYSIASINGGALSVTVSDTETLTFIHSAFVAGYDIYSLDKKTYKVSSIDSQNLTVNLTDESNNSYSNCPYTYVEGESLTITINSEQKDFVIIKAVISVSDSLYTSDYTEYLVESIDTINNKISIVKKSDYLKREQIVETSTPYLEADLFDLKYGQNADVLTICNRNYPPKELSRTSHYNWDLNNVVTSAQISPPTNVTAAWTGSTSQNTTTYYYMVTAVENGSYEESIGSTVASAVGHLESSWATSEWMTITWDEVVGATEYNIYRSVNGIYGFIGTSADTSFKDTKIEPDLTATVPIQKDPFENNNYPSCVNYFQQRKLFGCLKNDPQTLVMSQTGTDSNFNISRPLNASDAITIKLYEREVNEVRHLVGLNDLIVLTSGAEWKLTGSDGTMSAANPPSCTPQSYYGCSNIQPCISGNMVLFVQGGGSVIRDLGYEYVSDSYNGDELTIFATHLFENKQIVDMAYSKEPYRILWCVMSDGSLNALTYNKKQEVAGWHRHETKGEFESVAVIREGFEDVAYFVVKRKIGNTTKRFIERMHTRLLNNVQDGFFVDCGLKGSFDEPISTITGLSHLEGEYVTALADGGVEENLKVQSGQITLNQPASNVVVGLPYEFELETLNIEGENTHGLKKLITEVNIKIDKSREDFYVVGQNGVAIQNPRSKESIDDSNLLITGDVPAYPFADYTENASVKIKQNKPLPLTITSISAVVTLDDEDTNETGQ